jgi:hypothetical protein
VAVAAGLEDVDLQGEGSEAVAVEAGEEMNLSTPRPSSRSSPSIRIQAEGLEVHPERSRLSCLKGRTSRSRTGEKNHKIRRIRPFIFFLTKSTLHYIVL